MYKLQGQAKAYPTSEGPVFWWDKLQLVQASGARSGSSRVGKRSVPILSRDERERLSSLNSAELRHRLFDRPEFLDERNHRVLGIIEILRLLQYVRGVRFGHHRHAVLIRHNDVAAIHLHAGAGHRNVDAREAIVIDGGRWHHPAAEYRELQLANLGCVAHAAVDDRSRKDAI